MKIILISPQNRPAAMNFLYCMDIAGAKASHVPLGLATVAALTPSWVNVEIIDENVEQHILRADVDAVGITGMLTQSERVFYLAREYKKAGKHVVIGGPITFDMRDECAKEADTVFIGEAELTWPRFIEDFANGTPEKIYEQKTPVDMGLSPSPRYDLLKTMLYTTASIQATRGCPYRCDFCDIPVRYGNSPRSKGIGQVLEEIKAACGRGFDAILFADDNFIGDKTYAKELLRRIASLLSSLWPRPYFYTQATINIADDEELLCLLQEAGFRRLLIGVETFNEASLLKLNKTHNTGRDIEASIRNILRHGITVWASMIFGIECRTRESFEGDVRRILDAGAVPIHMGLLQAIPGTALYERAIKETRVMDLPSIFGSAALADPRVKKTTNLLHDILTEQQLNNGFAKALKDASLPEAYAKVIVRNIKESPRGICSSMPQLSINNFIVFFRTFFYYLFIAEGSARRMFLTVLKNIVLSGLRNMDETFFHLVIYKHFRRHCLEVANICETTVNEDMSC